MDTRYLETLRWLLGGMMALSWGIPTVALAENAAPGWKTVAPAEKPDAAVSSGCIDCHGVEGDMLTFGDGSKKSVFVDEKAWKTSAHGTRLGCTDCHKGISDHPHPAVTAKTARAYAVERAEVCKHCHQAAYARMLDGIHFEVAQKAGSAPATCVDCHGAHDAVQKQPRALLNRSCAGCHAKLYEKFQHSAHGKAIASNNPDVPGCTDCHGAHAVTGPKRAGFRAASFTLCARCHGDAKKMAKYKLSTDVLTTYLADFHGASNRLYALGAGTPDKPIADCIDCHGIHDVQRPAGHGTAEARTRIVQTCRKCHKDAPPEFADAWLSHHQPSLAGAPLVWGVKWTYKLMIPFILAGLITHILLHLWRVRTHR